MQEADILNSRVVVMKDGGIKTLGSSLYLKNKYGGGYKINVCVN